MVKCLNCSRAFITSYQEEIPNCPYCSSESHHIYHLRPGFFPTYNKRIMMLLRQQRHNPKGRCFLTPKGFFVPLGGMRHYSKTQGGAGGAPSEGGPAD